MLQFANTNGPGRGAFGDSVVPGIPNKDAGMALSTLATGNWEAAAGIVGKDLAVDFLNWLLSTSPAQDQRAQSPESAAQIITLLAAGAWNHKISDQPDGWKNTESAMPDIRARVAAIGCPLPVIVPQKDNKYLDNWNSSHTPPDGMADAYGCLVQKLTTVAHTDAATVGPTATGMFLVLLGKPGSPTSIGAPVPSAAYMTAVMFNPNAPRSFPVGSVARWNAPSSEWWIFYPGNSGALAGVGTGLGSAHLGQVFAAATGEVMPDAKVAGTEASVPNGTVKGKPMVTPFYKKGWFWGVVAGGVAVVGVGGYFVFHK